MRFARTVTNERARNQLYAKSVLEHAVWPLIRVCYKPPKSASGHKRLATRLLKMYRNDPDRYEKFKAEHRSDADKFKTFERVWRLAERASANPY